MRARQPRIPSRPAPGPSPPPGRAVTSLFRKSSTSSFDRNFIRPAPHPRSRKQAMAPVKLASAIAPMRCTSLNSCATAMGGVVSRRAVEVLQASCPPRWPALPRTMQARRPLQPAPPAAAAPPWSSTLKIQRAPCAICSRMLSGGQRHDPVRKGQRQRNNHEQHRAQITLNSRCTMAVRLAVALVPELASSAVTQVPMF